MVAEVSFEGFARDIGAVVPEVPTFRGPSMATSYVQTVHSVHSVCVFGAFSAFAMCIWCIQNAHFLPFMVCI